MFDGLTVRGDELFDFTQLGVQALDCMLLCEVRLLILDDLHFLKWRKTSGVEVSNHLKPIANEFPVTLLKVGVGLADKGLFSEGEAAGDTALAQTGRRTTRLGMPPFTIDTEQGRSHWRQLCWPWSSASNWPFACPGMLADDGLSRLSFSHLPGPCPGAPGIGQTLKY
ncbi:hypothetical protein [Streptomyces sp. NPDC002763]|uniref:hypothetical protein n=1 Tax=Streptomyces sp. NPDC002763 TaxID=3154427 RepID=UPI003323048E